MRQEHKRFCAPQSSVDNFAAMLASVVTCTVLHSLSLDYNYRADAEKVALCYAWVDTRDGLSLIHSPVAVHESLPWA
jgi:hypothetical protein